MTYHEVCKVGSNYYLKRRWREGGKLRAEVLARYGPKRPSFFDPIIICGKAQEEIAKLEPDSVHLIVTSPPYFTLKEAPWKKYEDYVQMLDDVWKACWMALDCGCRLCVNIGDECASVQNYTRHFVFPIHASIIEGAQKAGFDYMGSVIWNKAKTLRSSGGGSMIGSGAQGLPREFLVAYDYEYILIFKKTGRPKRTPSDAEKRASRIPLRERKLWYDARWSFPGERKTLHPAPFPEELPYRLIRMFSFVGDTVLDPFMGSGTTLVVAKNLGRKSIGVDCVPTWCEVSRERICERTPEAT